MNHPVVRIALATTLLVTSFAMYAPVLAVLLQQQGHTTTAIGAFAMIGFACVAISIPVLPRILARWGEVRVMRVGASLWFVACIGYVSFDSLLAWSLVAVVGGLGSAAVWNATESLIARYAPPDRRGHVTGLYQTLLGLALALGPFVPSVMRISGWQTLVAACVVQALALAMVARLPPLPRIGTAGGSLLTSQTALSTWQALRRVPALAVIAFVGGVFEGGLSSVSAAHGAASGLSMAAAVSIVGALGVGSFLLQYPAGLVADRWLPSRVFGAAGLALLASSLLLAGSDRAPWLLWACAFVWGGVGGALYTLTMIRVAHQFRGHDTAAGTATMITGYTLGGALGPLVSGAALQYLAMPGFALWLALLSLLVMALAPRVTA